MIDIIINEDERPYFFLVSKNNYALGTSRGIGNSDRTFDIPFHDLARSYDLQSKLKLASAFLIKPSYSPPISYPVTGTKLIEYSAVFLAAFENDPEKSRIKRDYLVNNGLIRILVTDDKLLEQIKQII